jgi:poly(A) polymerase
MFYNPLSKEVIDYVGGQEDLKKKVIRAIGDPHQRIKEDRLRMIRAIRLACRFGFTIDLSTSAAIRAHAKELFPAVAIERIYQEFTKANQFHALAPMLKSLYEHELLGPIFPGLSNPDFAPLFLYPPNTPTIAYIASIVPSLGTLKLSKEETEFAAFYLNARAIHPREPIQWARLYADPRWPLVFPLLIAHGASSSEHETRQKELSFPIAVLKSGRPLVNAADLLARDLPPSPLIGQLLQQAEELMANERLYTKEALLSRLFQK